MAEKCTDEKGTSQPHQPLTVRQRKRMRRKQYLKELKRQNVYDENRVEQYEAADYYFENGLRKVYPYHFTFTTCVQEKWTGQPILEVFAEQFQSNTEENYRKAIEAGHLRVNGEPVGVDYCLKANDIIVSRIHRHENPVADEKVEIIHEDKDVLVVNKPASIPCQPCGRYRFNSMVFILCKELGLPTLRNIYRLDWQTSGVMMLGKTKEKAMILEHQIQNGFVTKEYVCRVQGEFPLGVVTLDRPIVCVSHRLFLWKVMPNGKPSKTVFERMSYNGTSSVVKCIPQEVRTAHHIRVHLQYLGHPILNDPVYNSDVWGPTRGKAGVYSRPDAEVIKDVVAIHRVGQWIEERNPILDLKLQAANSSRSQDGNLPRTQDDNSSRPQDVHLATNSTCHCCHLSGAQLVEGRNDVSVCECSEAKGVNRCCETQCPQDVHRECGHVQNDGLLSESTERDCPEDSECVGDDSGSVPGHNGPTEQIPCRDVQNLKNVDSLLPTVGSGEIADDSCCQDSGLSQCSASTPSSSSRLINDFSSRLVKDMPSVKHQSNQTTHTPDGRMISEPSAKRLKTQTNGTRGSCDVNSHYIVSTSAASVPSDHTGQKQYSQGSTRVDSDRLLEVAHLGFDIDKWVPDPHCAECTKTYLDPDPRKLMIYLHALRYTGPGWEYKTELPTWAEEDWQGE